ncbi:hypothetical protein ACE0DR_29050 [Azotobacter sp. CWF10]
MNWLVSMTADAFPMGKALARAKRLKADPRRGIARLKQTLPSLKRWCRPLAGSCRVAKVAGRRPAHCCMRFSADRARDDVRNHQPASSCNGGDASSEMTNQNGEIPQPVVHIA